MNGSYNERGGLMVGGARWQYLRRELSDPSVERYDLRLGEPSETSLALSSDTPCDLSNW